MFVASFLSLLLFLSFYANALPNFLIRQRSRSDGSVEIYAPYFLWNNAIEENTASLSSPIALYSSNGLLDVHLTVEAVAVETEVFAYNSRLFCFAGICNSPGPTLYVKPGDKLRINLVNNLEPGGEYGPNCTNIFIQDLGLLPNQNSPFLYADGGQSLQYEYTIPSNIMPGLHWYYSRVQGVSALQVMGGLLGALIVQPFDPFLYPPAFRNIPSNIILFTHIFLERDSRILISEPELHYSLVDEAPSTSSLSYRYLSNSSSSTLPLNITYHTLSNGGILYDAWLTNGHYQPVYTMQPHEWRLLHLLAASGDRILELEVRDASGYGNGNSSCEIRLLARNGRYYSVSRTGKYVNHLTLLQSERATIALRCSLPGMYYLQSVSTFNESDVFAQIGDYQTKSIQVLLKIQVTGTVYVMDDPPQDLSFIASTALTTQSTTTLSLSTAQNTSALAIGPDKLLDYGYNMPSNDDDYVIGVGSNCRLPCYDSILCSALSAPDNYSTASFPTVLNNMCRYSTYTTETAHTVYNASNQLVNLEIWGSGDYPYPIYIPGTVMQLASFENVNTKIANILQRDNYIPQYNTKYHVYGEIGEGRELWPAFIGKAQYKLQVHFNTNVSLVMITTPFLKYQDRGFIVMVNFTYHDDETVTNGTTPSSNHTLPVSLSSISQPPLSALFDSDSAQTHYLCAVNGSSFFYREVIDSSRKLRNISMLSCPNHFSNCQSSQCGGDQKTRALKLYRNVSIPLYPVLRNNAKVTVCELDLVGVALNGVGFYGPSDGSETCLSLENYMKVFNIGPKSLNYSSTVLWRNSCAIPKKYDGISHCGDIMETIGREVDKCGGHADHRGGVYKYHTLPFCLLDQLTQLTNSTTTTSMTSYTPHSPQLGWALDGFPIYGPVSMKGISMLPCGHGGAHPQLCLDPCNGYYGRLSHDDFMYRYYLPTTSNHVKSPSCSAITVPYGACARNAHPCCAATLPDHSLYPFTIGCLQGCTYDEILSNTCIKGKKKAITERYVPSKGQKVSSVNNQSYADVTGDADDGGGDADSIDSAAVDVGKVGEVSKIQHVLQREALGRAFSIYTHTTTTSSSGNATTTRITTTKQTLPAGLEDVYLSSIAASSAVGDEREDVTMYYTTQRAIMSYHEKTKGTVRTHRLAEDRLHVFTS
jgi:hypothetical protein